MALEYIHSFHLFRPAEAAKLCPGSHVAKSSKDLSAVMDASAGEVCEAATSSLQLSSVPLGLFPMQSLANRAMFCFSKKIVTPSSSSFRCRLRCVLLLSWLVEAFARQSMPGSKYHLRDHVWLICLTFRWMFLTESPVVHFAECTRTLLLFR